MHGLIHNVLQGALAGKRCALPPRFYRHAALTGIDPSYDTMEGGQWAADVSAAIKEQLKGAQPSRKVTGKSLS